MSIFNRLLRVCFPDKPQPAPTGVREQGSEPVYNHSAVVSANIVNEEQSKKKWKFKDTIVQEASAKGAEPEGITNGELHQPQQSAQVPEVPKERWNADEIFSFVRAGRVAALDEFLSKGLSPNFIGPDGRTLLTEAVLHSQSSLVSSLLEWGADPALADKNGSSPLEFAQNLGRQPIVALLRTHNADAQRTRGGTKPAVQSRKNPVTTPEKPPKLNSIETISQPPKRTSRGLDAVLVEAVKTFSFDGVVKAVLAGAPCTEHLHITADGRIKNAPLIQQCISCLTERVRLRRSKQVDVRAPTGAMVGAWIKAKLWETLRLHLAAGLNPNVEVEPGVSALAFAVRNHSNVAVLQLLTWGACITPDLSIDHTVAAHLRQRMSAAANPLVLNPELMLALLFRNTALVKEYLCLGVSPNAVSPDHHFTMKTLEEASRLELISNSGIEPLAGRMRTIANWDEAPIDSQTGPSIDSAPSRRVENEAHASVSVDGATFSLLRAVEERDIESALIAFLQGAHLDGTKLNELEASLDNEDRAECALKIFIRLCRSAKKQSFPNRDKKTDSDSLAQYIRSNDFNALENLLAERVDPNLEIQPSVTALLYACGHRNGQAAKLLLDWGAAVTTETLRFSIPKIRRTERMKAAAANILTPELILAASFGNEALIREYCECGLSPQARSPHGRGLSDFIQLGRSSGLIKTVAAASVSEEKEARPTSRTTLSVRRDSRKILPAEPPPEASIQTAESSSADQGSVLPTEPTNSAPNVNEERCAEAISAPLIQPAKAETPAGLSLYGTLDTGDWDFFKDAEDEDLFSADSQPDNGPASAPARTIPSLKPVVAPPKDPLDFYRVNTSSLEELGRCIEVVKRMPVSAAVVKTFIAIQHREQVQQANVTLYGELLRALKLYCDDLFERGV